MNIELRSRCPQCKAQRILWGGEGDPSNPESMDALEDTIPASTKVVCPRCQVVEEVALWFDGEQAEPWSNADVVETEHGHNAGPLPPKPWYRPRQN